MSKKFQAIQYLLTTLLVKISIASNGDERVIVKFYRAYSKKPTSYGKKSKEISMKELAFFFSSANNGW